MVIIGTQNSEKEYAGSAMIYTGLASGYNIESSEGEKMDYKAINSAFDNLMSIIKSRQTLEEVAVTLLAQHLMLSEAHPLIISKDHYKVLLEAIPKSTIDAVVEPRSLEKTIQNITDSLRSNHPTVLKKIVFSGNGWYSINKIGSISAKRRSNSDMVDFAYTCNDAGICQNTLNIFLEVVTERYKNLKEAETGSVVKYFENQLQKAFRRLSLSEEELKNFKESNRIINYNEQTKFVAEKKEDAGNQYNAELMNLKAATAAKNKLEKKLNIGEKINNQNEEILQKKNELSFLNAKIGLLEVQSPEDSLIAVYEQRSQVLRNELKDQIGELYNLSHSIDGIPIKIMLPQWLENQILVDKTQARVDHFEGRLKEIDQEYDLYAPLGSQLTKLEREINVAEREYLEILQSLNMAKIREQNIQLSSQLTIVDPPLFPIEPLASKRAILIIASFMAGLILVLTILVVAEFLDSTLKTVEISQKVTGLEVIGALPIFKEKVIQQNPEITQQLNALSAGEIISRVDGTEDLIKPKIIFLTSFSKGEGKTTTALELQKTLESFGKKTLALITDDSIQNVEGSIQYMPFKQMINANYLAEITAEPSLHEYEYLVIELPEIKTSMLPLSILKLCHLAIIVCKADISWGKSKARWLTQFNKLLKKPAVVFLNGVKSYHLDSLLGELPIERSNFKTRIKSILRLEFSKSKFKFY